MTGSTDTRLLLLDGHSLAYRAFFALPVENFSTTTGQLTNAVYGFTSMLINMLRDEKPTHVGGRVRRVPPDVPDRAVRGVQGQPGHDAGRVPGQVDLIKEVLDALRIPVIEKPGYEADDVIATLAARPATRACDVLIITGDRDAFQLVNDARHGALPKRGVSEMDRMTPAAVEERYGIPPAQLPGLRRPASASPATTCPAIPGVGEKTAAKWITRVRRRSTGSSSGSTRSRARPAKRCARTSPT